MLSDLATVKAALSIPTSDATQDAKLVQCLYACDTVFKNYCHRTFETEPFIMEFPWQGNTQDLPLLQRPIIPILGMGTLTASSPTISNITVKPPYSTSQILAGMPVAVTGAAQPQNMMSAIPPFTTIQSLSLPSATMSQNATASGTVPLIFGLDVYIDFGGNYGFGLNAFRNGPSNSSRLYVGLDYAPKVDQPDGTSKSGLLVLLGQSGYGGGLWALVPPGWGYGPGGMGGYGPYGGPLTQALPPVWPTFPGAVCVTYAAGTGTGGADNPIVNPPNGGTLSTSTTIPADLTLAVTEMTCYLWNNLDTGGAQVTNESFLGYNRGMVDAARNALATTDALSSIRDIATRYMEIPL